MGRIARLSTCFLGLGVVFVLACVKGDQQGKRTVPSKDSQQEAKVQQLPFDEVAIAKGSNSKVNEKGPRWLESLNQGDILIYQVHLSDGPEQSVAMRVSTLVRIKDGVAAQFEPHGPWPDELERKSYWLAGDNSGLFRLKSHPSLQDPGFVPLDKEGRVDLSDQLDTRWQIPADWHKGETEDLQRGSILDQGWILDELDMTIDEPIRGDFCARISKTQEGSFLRLSVCANLGVVQLEYGETEAMVQEHWQLTGFQRVVQ